MVNSYSVISRKVLAESYLVQSQFYTFKCEASKNVGASVDEFLKILAKMSTLNVNVTDEIQTTVFLNSLPWSYDQLKYTIKYGNNSLGLEEVMSTARFRERELSEMSNIEKGSTTVLYSNDRGRSSRRDTNNSRRRNRSMSKSRPKVTCWYCKKEGHVKKDCFLKKKKMESDDEGEDARVIDNMEDMDV